MTLAHSSAEGGASIPTELVARLEAASVGSVELDCDIGIALGDWTPPKGGTRNRERPDVWRRNDLKHYQPYTEVTRSLDAALALAERVLPGWMVVNLCEWEHDILRAKGPWFAGLKPLGTQDRFDVIGGRCEHAPTPALALCIAILRATTAPEAGAVGTTEGREPQPPTTREGADR